MTQPRKRYHSTPCRKAANNARSTRSAEKSHKARSAAAEAHDVEFIAVDGEGQDAWGYREVWDDEEQNLVTQRFKTHHYVLLSVGDQSLHRNGAMLEHDEIFTFLYEQKLANPKAAFVGFFLGYDFSQWLKTLHYRNGYSLFTKAGIAARTSDNPDIRYPFPVYVDKRWAIDILGMKRFKLRPHVRKKDWPDCAVNHKTPEAIEECATGVHKKHPYQWMYICDSGAFFQSSLMTAIDPKTWAPGTAIVTDKELAILQEGKDARATAKFDPAMIRYNLLENDVLSRLMSVVNQGFVSDGIRLKTDQWYGPGQAAQAWLRLVGCPTGEEVREAVPESAIEAARASYFGGWFEIMFHGPIPGETYAYDINSAYPFAIAQLPCLLHGDWKEGKGNPGKLREGNLRLINARVKGTDPYIGTMPHRNENGNIARPSQTAGWYWQDEIDAAKRAGIIKSCVVTEWIEYRPCGCPPPLASIADLYEGRLKVGKNTPFGKSKKLIYNSAYGKFAQSIGQPKYANSIYASRITSHCRRMILDAIATHPDKTAAVAMVATDSVTFLTPHPTLEIDGNKLGLWDETIHHNLSLMMPGLYWDDTSRLAIAEGKLPKLKSRGVSPKYLANFINEIDRKWGLLVANGEATYDSAPAVELNIEFSLISPKLAAHRGAWYDCGRVVWNEPRVISANPETKRSDFYAAPDRPGALRSGVRFQIDGMDRTLPYDKTFGAVPVIDLRELEERLTPDGTVNSSIHAVLPNK